MKRSFLPAHGRSAPAQHGLFEFLNLLLSIGLPSFRSCPAYHDRLACGFPALRAGRAHPPLLAALDATHRPESGCRIPADGRERSAAEAVQGSPQ
jgi:hypothetical protein